MKHKTWCSNVNVFKPEHGAETCPCNRDERLRAYDSERQAETWEFKRVAVPEEKTK